MTADTPAPEPLGQRADVVIDTLLGWLTGPDSGQNDGIMAAVNLVRELAAANAALELRLAGAQDGLDIAAEAMGARIAAAELAAAVEAARREGVEQAARWHDDRAVARRHAGLDQAADEHRAYAAAIRARSGGKEGA